MLNFNFSYYLIKLKTQILYLFFFIITSRSILIKILPYVFVNLIFIIIFTISTQNNYVMAFEKSTESENRSKVETVLSYTTKGGFIALACWCLIKLLMAGAEVACDFSGLDTLPNVYSDNFNGPGDSRPIPINPNFPSTSPLDVPTEPLKPSLPSKPLALPPNLSVPVSIPIYMDGVNSLLSLLTTFTELNFKAFKIMVELLGNQPVLSPDFITTFFCAIKELSTDVNFHRTHSDILLLAKAYSVFLHEVRHVPPHLVVESYYTMLEIIKRVFV